MWNWEQTDWPNFSYDSPKIESLEKQFLYKAGSLDGSLLHLVEDEKENLTLELILDEAIKTSEIEGEILNRDSVQSSIRRQLGFSTKKTNATLREEGIAEMMVYLYRKSQSRLAHKTLFDWNKMLTQGRRDLQAIGKYRTHPEPMQIISGAVHKPTIHFEAPPSSRVKAEMDRFLEWFNNSKELPAITRAGITHLYFLSIHPFEDGNGRIGRALSEKSLAQSLGKSSLVALAGTIESNKKDYYSELHKASVTNELTSWLLYFGKTVLEAQSRTQAKIEFIINKAKFYGKHESRLNPRQQKVISKLFESGIGGFKGGLSANNYIAITKTSRATATRDLADLVDSGVLEKRGELKHSRYFLIL